jgi:hypothetical protein
MSLSKEKKSKYPLIKNIKVKKDGVFLLLTNGIGLHIPKSKIPTYKNISFEDMQEVVNEQGIAFWFPKSKDNILYELRDYAPNIPREAYA